jgi:hypothetical protein
MNSTIPPRHSSMDNAAAYLITLPYIAMARGGALAKTVLTRKPSKQPAKAQAPQPTQVAATVVEKRAAAPLVIADRVHSELIGSQKVCFYQYNQVRRIKITTRQNGFMKEAIFSPEAAIAMSLPFTIESAAKWIRENWFEPHAKSHTETLPESSTARGNIATAKSIPAKSDGATEVYPQRFEEKAKLIQSQKRPFEGQIVDFGVKQMPGHNDKPNYTTYFITLENSRIGRRDFIGEQLSELVEEHELQKGQHVRLHQLGKRMFQVLERGVKKERSRNEYLIDLL